jgi:hypothetical protein
MLTLGRGRSYRSANSPSNFNRAGTSARLSPIDSHPSPNRAARSTAFSPSPPTRIGGTVAPGAIAASKPSATSA